LAFDIGAAVANQVFVAFWHIFVSPRVPVIEVSLTYRAELHASMLRMHKPGPKGVARDYTSIYTPQKRLSPPAF
jgi:hypothetical protein